MRNFAIFIIIILFFVLSFFKINNNKDVRKADKTFMEFRGIFISYIDYKDKFSSDDKAKSEIISMIDNVEKEKFNLIILQVRSFSDSLYNSEVFEKSSLVNCNMDVLDFFVKEGIFMFMLGLILIVLVQILI